MTGSHPASVAILGSGPRTLWALEHLLAQVRLPGSRPLGRVEVIGPGELGAGQVYRTDQPEYLRLNVRSAVVDAWTATRGGPSFDTWREQHAPGSSREQYPARALTGRYLSEQADLVLSRLAEAGVEVRRQTQLAVDLHRAGEQWWVDQRGPYDEVLLALGHAADWDGALRHRWDASLPPLHPEVFPVADLVARPEIRGGGTVLVRGAALTAIDAVLALTTGRTDPSMTGEVVIELIGRSGAMMLPKTDPEVVAARVEQVGDLTRFRDRLTQHPGDHVAGALIELATALLGGGPAAGTAVELALAELHQPAAARPAAEQLRFGVEMATGRREPDGAWALGQAWRVLYPDLVALQRAADHRGPTLAWPDFALWARAMERWAFGPPLANAQILADLVDRGQVRLTHGVAVADRAARLRPDLVVDAVLAPPGTAGLSADHLLSRLRRRGQLAVSGPPHRAVLVDGRARVLDVRGEPVTGLALVGRASEGVVLGTDTLIRELHPDIDRWARGVLGADPDASDSARAPQPAEVRR